jgi:Ser/Thr protein kinase RdoA (MazF antagonist)
LARTFAQVHAELHESSGISELPVQKQFFPTVIQRLSVLPPDLKESTLKALDEIPTGDRLCHGDFHPYNVLLSSRGPVVIDWNNAHIGNPLEDVARSNLMLAGVSMSEPALSSALDLFAKAYLERYQELRPYDQEDLRAWRPIVAAVRLADDIPELQDWLLAQIQAGLGLND